MSDFRILAPTLLLALSPVSAHAGSPSADSRGGVPTAMVNLHGLDVATPRGQRTARVRLASAVEAVCGSYEGASPEEQDRIGRCRKNSIADIAPQVARIMTGSGLRLTASDIMKL